MNDKSNKHSSLFLMELIIAILMFSLCAAVCINIFIRAHSIKNNSYDLTMAVMHTSNMAEIFSNSSNFEELFEVQYDSLSIQNSDTTSYNGSVYFDSKWVECTQSDATYTASIEIHSEDNSQIGTFSVADSNEKVIYNLQSRQHRKEITK